MVGMARFERASCSAPKADRVAKLPNIPLFSRNGGIRTHIPKLVECAAQRSTIELRSDNGADEETRTLMPKRQILSLVCLPIPPHLHLAGTVGFEPTSYGFGDRCVTITPSPYWLERVGSNYRNARVKVLCLTAWLRSNMPPGGGFAPPSYHASR